MHPGYPASRLRLFTNCIAKIAHIENLKKAFARVEHLPSRDRVIRCLISTYAGEGVV